MARASGSKYGPQNQNLAGPHQARPTIPNPIPTNPCKTPNPPHVLLGFPLQAKTLQTLTSAASSSSSSLKGFFGFWVSLRNGSETLKVGEENIVRQEAMRLAQPVLPDSNRPRRQRGLEPAPEHSLRPPRWLGGFDGQEHNDEANHQDPCGGVRERGCQEHPSSFGGMLHMILSLFVWFFFCGSVWLVRKCVENEENGFWL